MEATPEMAKYMTRKKYTDKLKEPQNEALSDSEANTRNNHDRDQSGSWLFSEESFTLDFKYFTITVIMTQVTIVVILAIESGSWLFSNFFHFIVDYGKSKKVFAESASNNTLTLSKRADKAHEMT